MFLCENVEKRGLAMIRNRRYGRLYMKKLVIILGMCGSGTSLLAQICQHMGAYLGGEEELISLTADDIDRYFENKEIVKINDSILRFYGKDYYSPEMFKIDCGHPQIIKEMKKLEVCIQTLLGKNNTVVIKDPRISLMLPLWEKVLEKLEAEVCYVWIYRNPLEIAEVLRKNEYSDSHIIYLWMRYNFSILQFLNGRNRYLKINYADFEQNLSIFEAISQLIGKEGKLSEDLKWKLAYIIKYEWRHSQYSYQDVLNMQCKLLSDLYGALLESTEDEVNTSDLEIQYSVAMAKTECKYMDYEVLENIKCLEQEEIIIYGAGDYGRQAADILQELGLKKFCFCDKDSHKQKTGIMNRKVYSIREIEELENRLIIIAVHDNESKKKIELTLRYLRGVHFLSFFALKAVWKYNMKDCAALENKAEAFSIWHHRLSASGNCIRKACKSPILVYQYGKVGSSTISDSLKNAGIMNVHIHNFFAENHTRWKPAFANEIENFVKNSDFFCMQSPEYVRNIKDKMKHKKIITMVRDPIAVDLSGVFQLMGNEINDRCIAEKIQTGKGILQTVSELAMEMQDGLFDWFDRELKTVFDVDVFSYPFDKEKGFTIIRKNTVEILLIKTEKISQMTEVLRNFTDNQKLQLRNTNVGKEKEYVHIYEEVKRKVKFPKTYVEHYYKNNPYMDHFYSKEEQKIFYNKWMA